MTNSILDQINANRVDYDSIIDSSTICYNDKLESYVSIIITARGRADFIKPVVESLRAAIGDRDISITIVEHAHALEHEDICIDLDLNYIGIPCGSTDQFAKSLASNIGAFVNTKSQWLLMHDIDCLVQEDFFDLLEHNIDKTKAICTQPFFNNRVLYCNKHLTTEILNGKDFNDLNKDHKGISTYPGKAPGGSIFFTRDLFFLVGGYDPELFHGYAPEDAFFWNKASMKTNIFSANSPIIEMFHMHHETRMNSNPDIMKMIRISEGFRKLSIKGKMKIIEHKRKLIEKWQ